MRWQLRQAVWPAPRVCSLVENSVLLVDKSMTGATGNIYCGLLDFEDMAFVLHVLRPGDIMGDIGANVGVYTILAAKNTGAYVIAIEPIPTAFQHLQVNINLNNVENLTSAINCGAGKENGELQFTKDLDAVNHVTIPVENMNNAGLVKIITKTLDNIFLDTKPVLLKIDVEGYEHEVLKGAKTLLESADIKAIIIELNGSGMRYGFSDEKIHEQLISFGFAPYRYEPFTRKMELLERPGAFNTIYLRDEHWVADRIASARKFNVIGHLI